MFICHITLQAIILKASVVIETDAFDVVQATKVSDSLAPESAIVDFIKHFILVHPMTSVMYFQRSANKSSHSLTYYGISKGGFVGLHRFLFLLLAPL